LQELQPTFDQDWDGRRGAEKFAKLTKVLQAQASAAGLTDLRVVDTYCMLYGSPPA